MNDRVRIAAVGDIHCSKTNREELRQLLSQMSRSADIIVLCGDLTDNGLLEEAQILAGVTKTAGLPVVGVLGNHDFEGDRQAEIKAVLTEAGVFMLDGESCRIAGVGFAGVKGFGGGFGKYELPLWGERMTKQFVREAIDEELKLESALARLEEPRVVVTHYAPVRATVEGEALEIFPFLGSGRLEDAINRYGVAAAFHGHAHHGQAEGTTTAGVPVYNVAIPVLQRTFPGQPPFRVIEVAVGIPSAGSQIH
jgi:Icc-related predicted phosphoesterase